MQISPTYAWFSFLTQILDSIQFPKAVAQYIWYPEHDASGFLRQTLWGDKKEEQKYFLDSHQKYK